MIKLIVEDIVNVLGRGNIICCTCHTLDECANINLNDKVLENNIEFKIIGVERWSYSKSIGIVFSPNKEVKDSFHIGKEFTIIK